MAKKQSKDMKKEKTAEKQGAKGEHAEKRQDNAPSLKAVWQLLKPNKSALAYMLFVDAAFVMAAFFFRRFVELIAPSLTPEALVANATLALYGLALVVVYYLLVLLLYSLAKFFVMHLIKGMKSSEGLQFDRFFPFYGLNVMLTGIFFLIMLSLAYIFAALKQPYEVAGFLVLVVPYLLVLFVVLNSAHSMFFAKRKVAWGSIVSAFKFAFNSMRQYGFVLGWNAVFGAVFVIVLFVPGMLIRSFADNPALYASSYKAFSVATSTLSTFVLYCMAIFSRVGFYLAVEAKDDLSS